jgi:hypothetical protein
MRHIDASEPRNALIELEADEVVIGVTRDELAGLANTIGEALNAVDHWEFDSRVGLLPDHARRLREQISEVLRATFRPE